MLGRMDVGRVDDDAMARTDDAEAWVDGRSHGSDVWMMTPRLGRKNDAKAMEDDATARKEVGVYHRFSYFGKKWLRFFHPMRNPGVARHFCH